MSKNKKTKMAKKKMTDSDVHCRCFVSQTEVKWDNDEIMMSKGEKLIETFPGSEIIRAEHLEPGMAGMGIEIFEEKGREKYIKEIEPVLFTKMGNYELCKTKLEGDLGGIQGMIAGYLNEVEKLRGRENQLKKILGRE